jgi:heavy metal sensor kinase
VVMAVFLAGTYDVVYTSFALQVRTALDERLLDVARPILAELTSTPGLHLSTLEIPRQLVQWIGPDGALVERSRSFQDIDLDLQPLPSGSDPEFRTFQTAAGEMRAAMIPVQVVGQPHWLVIAESTDKASRAESDFREQAFGLWTVSLLLTTLIAAWYVGRSLSPIVDLSRHATTLIARLSSSPHQDFEASLPIVNPNDELGILAANFNALFDRLAAVVRQLRQFVSDAAHELRTPLSVVRGETQFLLSQPRSAEEYQTTLRTIDGELTVMVRMIEGLFTLSMADAGQLQLGKEDLYLNEVIEEACGLAAPVARKKGLRVEFAQSPELRFSGDQVLLRQLFLILLENAIKYSPPDTTIGIRLTIVGGHPVVAVQDEGSGISSEDLPHIFERFYRAAPQSSDETRSGGLGLAIADAIMRAHGGTIHCQSELGKGSTFFLSFAAENRLLEAGKIQSDPNSTPDNLTRGENACFRRVTSG